MKVITHLMFQDGRAREAAEWYVSVVPGSKILHASGGGDAGPTIVSFSLAGHEYLAVDSPPVHAFTFTPSMSIFVTCDSESEVDALFNTVSKDGGVMMPLADYGFSKRFGWCADRFGVSWQVGLPPG